jgi:hypothetical protein
MCKQIDNKRVALLPKIYVEFFSNPFSFWKKKNIFDGSSKSSVSFHNNF